MSSTPHHSPGSRHLPKSRRNADRASDNALFRLAARWPCRRTVPSNLHPSVASKVSSKMQQGPGEADICFKSSGSELPAKVLHPTSHVLAEHTHLAVSMSASMIKGVIVNRQQLQQRAMLSWQVSVLRQLQECLVALMLGCKLCKGLLTLYRSSANSADRAAAGPCCCPRGARNHNVPPQRQAGGTDPASQLLHQCGIHTHPRAPHARGGQDLYGHGSNGRSGANLWDLQQLLLGPGGAGLGFGFGMRAAVEWYAVYAWRGLRTHLDPGGG